LSPFHLAAGTPCLNGPAGSVAPGSICLLVQRLQQEGLAFSSIDKAHGE
jgi:hypothetical protein